MGKEINTCYSVQVNISNEYIVAVDLYDSRSHQKTFIPFIKKYNEYISHLTYHIHFAIVNHEKSQR